MSLSKGSVKEYACAEKVPKRTGVISPSFAFSAQSTAGFPALPGKRDTVAMAVPEAGSSQSWRTGTGNQGGGHEREVVAKR